MNAPTHCWIFQASPQKYDINKYLLEIDDYIYWRAKQNSSQMRIGDIVYLWRGEMTGFPRGIIAMGIVHENPTKISNVHFPEKIRDDLWKTKINDNDLLVGIKLISNIRLTEDDGMITIDTIKNEPVINKMPIVTAPRQTNYLLNIEEYTKINELWNTNDKYAGSYIIRENERLDDKYIEAIKNRDDINATTKMQLINARLGQGIFRARVIFNEKKCRVTGVSDPKYLIASHIKPWVDSSNEEKLHGCNGLLLSPHIDYLFDRGMISFANNGDVLVSPKLDISILNAWSISDIKNVGTFNSKQIEFLDYHRMKKFQK